MQTTCMCVYIKRKREICNGCTCHLHMEKKPLFYLTVEICNKTLSPTISTPIIYYYRRIRHRISLFTNALLPTSQIGETISHWREISLVISQSRANLRQRHWSAFPDILPHQKSNQHLFTIFIAQFLANNRPVLSTQPQPDKSQPVSGWWTSFPRPNFSGLDCFHTLTAH